MTAGGLARAQETCESVTQTGIFALNRWRAGNSTSQLAAVQMTDAHDEVVKPSWPLGMTLPAST